MPILLSLVVSVLVAFGAGYGCARDHYLRKINAVEDAAQRQKEHADEVSRQLARNLAGLQDRLDTVRRDADLYRRSAAGHAGCLDPAGMSIVNEALAGSKRTTRAVP